MRAILHSLLVAAGLSFLLPATLHADPTRQLKVTFAVGHEGANQINLQGFRDIRTRNFPGQLVRFHTDLPAPRPAGVAPALDTRQMLAAMQDADIFWYTGHSGRPKAYPNTQVLAARPSGGGDDGIILAVNIRAAFHGRRGPRLVIINGCCTTADNDGVPAAGRLSNAFGITDNTEERAYLGWNMPVGGQMCDQQMSTLINHWTTPNGEGVYPTLEESVAVVNNPRLKRIGGRNLRYNLPLLLRSANPRHTAPPVRLHWRLTGANTAQAVVDFGPELEPELRKLGIDRRWTLTATRTTTGFEVRDPRFQRLVQQVIQCLASGLGGLGDARGSVSVQVHEAVLQIRGEGDNLRMSLRVRATTTTTLPGRPPQREVVNATNELIATPDRNVNRRQRPPA